MALSYYVHFVLYSHWDLQEVKRIVSMNKTMAWDM